MSRKQRAILLALAAAAYAVKVSADVNADAADAARTPASTDTPRPVVVDPPVEDAAPF
jgi:hypothetical protein